MPMMNTARILEAVETFNASGFSRPAEVDVAHTLKVKQLLRLAVDAGTTEAEREAAGRKAVRLIALHGLEICPPRTEWRMGVLADFLVGIGKAFQL